MHFWVAFGCESCLYAQVVTVSATIVSTKCWSHTQVLTSLPLPVEAPPLRTSPHPRGSYFLVSPPNSERLGDCRVGAALVWSFKRVVSRAVGDFEAWTDERYKRQTNPNNFIPNAEQLHPAFAKIIALMFAPLVHLEIEPLGSLYKNGFHVFFFIFTQWVI